MNNIDEIRIYAEVIEQGFDIKEYLEPILKRNEITAPVRLVYTKKIRQEANSTSSILSRIRGMKDIDIAITSISDGFEFPLLLIEYSTAVPTDDHIMQRSDVQFWSSKFGVPSLKISPTNKGMGEEKNHGGGNKINDAVEKYVAAKSGGVYYTIKWENIPNTNNLETDNKKLSCIPFSDDLSKILENIITSYTFALDYDEFWTALRKDFTAEVESEGLSTESILELFPDSQRFHRCGNSIVVKINRFGHAMDPDRGILYFQNMLNGQSSLICEFQIERDFYTDGNRRGGYAPLFDGLSCEQELKKIVNELLKSGADMDAKTAVKIFFTALNLNAYFPNVAPDENNKVILDPTKFEKYLLSPAGIAAKSLFYLTDKIILTSKNRELLATIEFDKSFISEFFQKLTAFNYAATPIEPLSNSTANEDIITFATTKLMRVLGIELAAVSYPGAQGDKCVLIGSGRGVKREYVDVIGFKKSGTDTRIFLQENKDYIIKSSDDIEKLLSLVNDPEKRTGLSSLLDHIIGPRNIYRIYVGIGGKNSVSRPPKTKDVDYIILFDISGGESVTSIDCTVAIINIMVYKDFVPIAHPNGRLSYTINLEPIFIIS